MNKGVKILSMKSINILSCIVFLTLIFGCSKDNDLNFFSVGQDAEFGAQLDSAILANPDTFPVLNRQQYPQVYTYVETMMNNILESDRILYKEEFNWKLTIINDDIMNAFAAPGGYVYVYTGLIKYLDKGSELAGIMAHEIAHADRRHSTEAMTKQYGFSILLSIILGQNPSQMEEILASLALQGSALAYSRKNENEADEFAVYYTADTRLYNPLGVAGFFEKLLAAGEAAGIPEFLSTHPSEENRVENINNIWNELKSEDPALASVQWSELIDEHQSIKASLP